MFILFNSTHAATKANKSIPIIDEVSPAGKGECSILIFELGLKAAVVAECFANREAFPGDELAEISASVHILVELLAGEGNFPKFVLLPNLNSFHQLLPIADGKRIFIHLNREEYGVNFTHLDIPILEGHLNLGFHCHSRNFSQ